MSKKQLSLEEKRLDTDLWIIAIITFVVYLCYAVTGNQLLDYVKNNQISVIPRLLVNASVQFGIAGLGISIVCILRKEKISKFGLIKHNMMKSIIYSVVCFIPYICYIFVSGQYEGYRPFSILISNEILKSGFPLNILGVSIIAIVWGFFEGFNYVVISYKLNRRYPTKNQWKDIGAITSAIICVLFHPLSISFWGVIDILTMFIVIYGMLIVKKKTQNAWGCVFVFCFIWNAF